MLVHCVRCEQFVQCVESVHSLCGAILNERIAQDVSIVHGCGVVTHAWGIGLHPETPRLAYVARQSAGARATQACSGERQKPGSFALVSNHHSTAVTPVHVPQSLCHNTTVCLCRAQVCCVARKSARVRATRACYGREAGARPLQACAEPL